MYQHNFSLCRMQQSLATGHFPPLPTALSGRPRCLSRQSQHLSPRSSRTCAHHHHLCKLYSCLPLPRPATGRQPLHHCTAAAAAASPQSSDPTFLPTDPKLNPVVGDVVLDEAYYRQFGLRPEDAANRAAPDELDPEGEIINQEEDIKLEDMYKVDEQKWTQELRDLYENQSSWGDEEAVLVAGFRAEEVSMVRTLLDSAGGQAVKVLPVTSGLLYTPLRNVIRAPEIDWAAPRPADFVGGGWGAQRTVLFAGMKYLAQAAVVELLESAGLPQLCVIGAEEADADIMLGEILARAVKIARANPKKDAQQMWETSTHRASRVEDLPPVQDMVEQLAEQRIKELQAKLDAGTIEDELLTGEPGEPGGEPGSFGPEGFNITLEDVKRAQALRRAELQQEEAERRQAQAGGGTGPAGSGIVTERPGVQLVRDTAAGTAGRASGFTGGGGTSAGSSGGVWGSRSPLGAAGGAAAAEAHPLAGPAPAVAGQRSVGSGGGAGTSSSAAARSDNSAWEWDEEQDSGAGVSEDLDWIDAIADGADVPEPPKVPSPAAESAPTPESGPSAQLHSEGSELGRSADSSSTRPAPSGFDTSQKQDAQFDAASAAAQSGRGGSSSAGAVGDDELAGLFGNERRGGGEADGPAASSRAESVMTEAQRAANEQGVAMWRRAHQVQERIQSEGRQLDEWLQKFPEPEGQSEAEFKRGDEAVKILAVATNQGAPWLPSREALAAALAKGASPAALGQVVRGTTKKMVELNAKQAQKLAKDAGADPADLQRQAAPSPVGAERTGPGGWAAAGKRSRAAPYFGSRQPSPAAAPASPAQPQKAQTAAGASQPASSSGTTWPGAGQTAPPGKVPPLRPEPNPLQQGSRAGAARGPAARQQQPRAAAPGGGLCQPLRGGDPTMKPRRMSLLSTMMGGPPNKVPLQAGEEALRSGRMGKAAPILRREEAVRSAEAGRSGAGGEEAMSVSQMKEFAARLGLDFEMLAADARAKGIDLVED